MSTFEHTSPTTKAYPFDAGSSHSTKQREGSDGTRTKIRCCERPGTGDADHDWQVVFARSGRIGPIQRSLERGTAMRSSAGDVSRPGDSSAGSASLRFPR